MSRIPARILACLAVLLLVGSCGQAYRPPPVTPQLGNLSRASLPQLQTGYQVHQANCARCHAFEDPSRHDLDQLTGKIIPSMARKAHLGKADEQALLAYLKAARQLAPSTNPTMPAPTRTPNPSL